MSYVARIVGPAGAESFLARGREVSAEQATRYAHPSAALAAIDRYLASNPGLYADVLDERDPERVVA